MMRTVLPFVIALSLPLGLFADPPAADATPEVRAAVQKLVDATAKGDKEEITRLSQELAIPKLREWFEGAFTRTLDDKSQRALNETAASMWKSLSLSYRVEKGASIKDVRRFAAVADAPEGLAPRTFLRLMVKPQALYSVTLAVGEKTAELGCFLVLDGKIRFLSDAYAEMLADDRACRGEMKRLARAVYEFEKKNQRYPLDLGELTYGAENGGPAAPGCAFAPKEARGFVYVWPSIGDAADPNDIVAFDPAVHPDDRRVLMFVGGRVDVFPESGFRKMLAEQLARDKPRLEAELKATREGKALAGEDPKKKTAALEGLLKLAEEFKKSK